MELVLTPLSEQFPTNLAPIEGHIESFIFLRSSLDSADQGLEGFSTNETGRGFSHEAKGMLEMHVHASVAYRGALSWSPKMVGFL